MNWIFTLLNLGLTMEKWSKEEEDGGNKKEENRLETALSPAVAGYIFEGVL